MILLSLLLACAEPAPEAPPAAPIAEAPAAPAATGPSLYEMDLDLVDQTGASRELDLHRGHPVLISMFYSSCPQACPMLIQKIQSVEAALDPAVRDDVRVVMVSFDPERDGPAALSDLQARHGLDARWTLASVPEPQVRELSAILDIPYRKLPSGDYNHASIVTLLDRDGRVVARLDGTGADPAPVLDALSAMSPATPGS
jgi:protein SCO1/2